MTYLQVIKMIDLIVKGICFVRKKKQSMAYGPILSLIFESRVLNITIGSIFKKCVFVFNVLCVLVGSW